MGIYRIEIHDGWLMVEVWLLVVWVKKPLEMCVLPVKTVRFSGNLWQWDVGRHFFNTGTGFNWDFLGKHWGFN